MNELLTANEILEELILEQMKQEQLGKLKPNYQDKISKEVQDEYESGTPKTPVNPKRGDVLLLSKNLAGNKNSKRLCVVAETTIDEEINLNLCWIHLISNLYFPVFEREVRYDKYVVDILNDYPLQKMDLARNSWKIDEFDGRVMDLMFPIVTYFVLLETLRENLAKHPEFTLGEYVCDNKNNPKEFHDYWTFIYQSDSNLCNRSNRTNLSRIFGPR